MSLSNGRTWVGIGALMGALTVALGAFGAHALEERLTPAELETWHTAVLYQGLHAPALVLFGLWQLVTKRSGCSAALLISIGVLGFSGSLYAYVLGGPRWLVFVTPVGGLLMLAGWLAWSWQALRGREQ